MAGVSLLALFQGLLDRTPKGVPQQFNRGNPEWHDGLFFTTDRRYYSLLIGGIVDSAARILDNPCVSCPVVSSHSVVPYRLARFGGKQTWTLATGVEGTVGTPPKTALGGKDGWVVKLDMRRRSRYPVLL